MRVLSVCTVVLLTMLACAAEPDAVRLGKYLKSANYTVSWKPAAAYDPDSELEMGKGSGHGGTLGWMRFVPATDGVEVLAVQLDEGWHPYQSKWPPDIAPVTVTQARMGREAYASLLRDLAALSAAELRPIRRNSTSGSSNDFWVQVRLTTGGKTSIDYDWAGYAGSLNEIQYAKPSAALALVRETTADLDFRDHDLTGKERDWAGAKFARDWTKFRDRDFYWWVQERYLVVIGVVGNATAVPLLQSILETEPKGRCLYHAINAVTRLTKKDLREKPVEEMDVDRVREKVLDSLSGME